mgnify:CR=1 FL=1
MSHRMRKEAATAQRPPGSDYDLDSVVASYWEPVLNWIRATGKVRGGEAEEVRQEVFLRVYRARGSYEPTAKFTTWIHRIAANACLNHIRGRRVRKSLGKGCHTIGPIGPRRCHPHRQPRRPILVPGELHPHRPARHPAPVRLPDVHLPVHRPRRPSAAGRWMPRSAMEPHPSRRARTSARLAPATRRRPRRALTLSVALLVLSLALLASWILSSVATADQAVAGHLDRRGTVADC